MINCDIKNAWQTTHQYAFFYCPLKMKNRRYVLDFNITCVSVFDFTDYSAFI